MAVHNHLRRLAGLVFIGLLSACAVAASSQEPELCIGSEVALTEGRLVYWSEVRQAALVGKAARELFLFEGADDPCQLLEETKAVFPPEEEEMAEDAPDGQREIRATVPPPVRSFEGLSLLANGSGWPPCANGDVGIRHYVQVVNSSIGIFDKATGALLGVTTFDAFFPPSCGEPCDNNNMTDPIVLFDHINRRWFLLNVAWSGTTNGCSFSIAASQTEDPTGAWWTYCFKADDTQMAASPRCGVWNDGIYITANMFAFGGSYQRTKIWAIRTPYLYRGTLTAQSTSTTTLRSFGMLPSCARGPFRSPSGSPHYLFSIDASEYGGLHTDALHVWKYAVNWSNPAASTLSGPVVLPVAPYDLSASRVPQFGTTWTLDSMYGRLMYAAIYRYNGLFSTSIHESVYLCHLAESMGSRAMRWYEVRINRGTPSVYQQGTYAPDATHRWTGSICADGADNVVLGYSASSTQMYPAIRFTGRKASSALGAMAGEQTLVAGTGSQSRISRWGDFSFMTIDPVDDQTFWYTHEYYLTTAVAPQLPDWHTRIGAFRIAAVPAAAAPVAAAGIGAALDLPGQAFYNRGTRDFVVTTESPYSGSSCIGVPAELTDSESCRLQTVTTGRTGVRFWWKVSSESGWDYLNFYIDGVLQGRISGMVAWTQCVYALTPGTHTLTWAYIKDNADSGGADNAWVDKVELF